MENVNGRIDLTRSEDEAIDNPPRPRPPCYQLNRRLRSRMVVAQLCICPRCPKAIGVIMNSGCDLKGCRMAAQ